MQPLTGSPATMPVSLRSLLGMVSRTWNRKRVVSGRPPILRGAESSMTSTSTSAPSKPMTAQLHALDNMSHVPAFQYVVTYLISALPICKKFHNFSFANRSCSTPHPLGSVWPRPGKEPLVNVDRAVLITVHYQTTVLTAIRPLPQGHVLLLLTRMTRLGRIAFIDDREFFPVQQTLVGKHLHKAVEAPVIIHHAVADTPLPPLFGCLFLLLLDDHLPLGKIANDNSPFSQFAIDEMGGLVQTVSLFIALALSNPLVHLGEVQVAPRLLLAAVALRADFVQLLVVPTVALEAADVVEAPLIVHPCCQRLDAQVESYNTAIAQSVLLALFPFLTGLVVKSRFVLLGIIIDERTVVVPPPVGKMRVSPSILFKYMAG